MDNPVIVLGMHRSGTSFAVRALNICGLWLGENNSLNAVEGRAGEGNPRGNYESNNVLVANEAILKTSGGDWANVPGKIIVNRQQRAAMSRLLTAIHNSKPEDSPRWGWKDPRTVLTLDVWAGLLPQGVTLVCLFRSPQLVADSLLARDGMALSQSLELWRMYNMLLLRHMSRFASYLIRFDAGKSELFDRLSAVCKSTGLNFDADTVGNWFDDDLLRSESGDGSFLLPDSIQEVWDRLMAHYEKQVF